ncbi:hypothetical protein F0P96_04450 [Hymenobacter busanensis]|uniref:Uncharacterized protein n=1 Tax=Hymenobacter busanensis TaxID=2607656 RepID=A0A7L4ZVY3_9BACT|nr:hypothetical protein [Hymenobacter busanensis]KAA9339873.1 hypothetical protein F0P96_04450 [Hymenobacter busanensis]QHJ06372.1 hypothetical protein GUY19_03285 [Hymenobacter busanensis]
MKTSLFLSLLFHSSLLPAGAAGAASPPALPLLRFKCRSCGNYHTLHSQARSCCAVRRAGFFA